MSQLYPRPRRERDQSKRRWRVDYNLAYEDGGSYWSGYYHHKVLAMIATFWNVNLSSWGGTAILYDQERDGYN